MITARYCLHYIGARLTGRSPLELDEFRERRLYPDLVDVGLASGLRVELHKLGSNVAFSSPRHPSLAGHAERGEREASVSTALLERAFHLSLWAEGLEHLSGWTSSLNSVASAVDQWLSDDPPGVEAMAARYPFLAFSELAHAYERGEAIEYAWASLLDRPPDERLRPLVQVAAADPTLRRLRPYTSLSTLCFSRWVGWPFSEDLPYAMPFGEGFRVYKARAAGGRSRQPEHLLGEGDAARAVELLLAGLHEPLDIVYRRPANRA